jgi:hypothetical protein
MRQELVRALLDLEEVCREMCEDCTQQAQHRARPGRVGACPYCTALEKIDRVRASVGEEDENS